MKVCKCGVRAGWSRKIARRRKFVDNVFFNIFGNSRDQLLGQSGSSIAYGGQKIRGRNHNVVELFDEIHDALQFGFGKVCRIAVMSKCKVDQSARQNTVGTIPQHGA